MTGLLAGLAVYLVSMAPGLSWGDSGHAQLHVLLGGWHVTGGIARAHVLYYAIARMVAWFCNPALAANIVAAVAGALTIANVAWLAAKLCRRRLAVFATTALLLFSHTLWQLSAAAEVVTLTTALLSAELIAFYLLLENRRLRHVAAVALLNGLGVANHNFALLMWPVYLVVAVTTWRQWWPVKAKALAIAAACLLVGMSPVLLLCVDQLRASGDLAWTVRSFLVGEYGSSVTNLGRLPALLRNTILITGLNFPTPLVLFTLAGPVVLWRRSARPFAIGFFGGFFVYFAFGARYDVADQHTFLVPAFLFLALLAGLGLDAFLARCQQTLPITVAIVILSLLAPFMYLATPPMLRRYGADVVPFKREISYRDRFNWFIHPWRTGDHGARRYAREVLESLPKDAWFVADSTVVPVLNYVQIDGQLRRDVRLDCWHARQDWLPPISYDSNEAREKALQGGRVFSSTTYYGLSPWLRSKPFRFEPQGLYFKVLPPPAGEPEEEGK